MKKHDLALYAVAASFATWSLVTLISPLLPNLTTLGDVVKTTAFWDIVKVLITGGIGFLGVWYGQRNGARKDSRQVEREAQEAQRELTMVASAAIEHLERYINGCLAVAYDDGTSYGQPAGADGSHEPTTTPPEFDPHTLKINWSALPPDLIYDIFAIRSRQEGVQAYLASESFDDPPDNPEYFWTRRLLYAELGQRVTATTLRLRLASGLPNEVLTVGGWSRDESFASVVERFKELQVQRESQAKELQALWKLHLGAG